MDLFPNPRLEATGAPPPERKLPLSAAAAGACRATKRSRERGSGNLKAIIWTVILVAFIYGAVMVLPVLISEYEFQDSLQEIARFASVNRKTAEQVRQSVMEEAQKEDLPVQAENIKVDGYSGNVHINVDYSVTVDLKVYQWTFNFHPAANNAALL
jgi:cell division protein FtsL